MTAPDSNLTRLVATTRLGESGQIVSVKATPDECAHLAQEFDLQKLNSLEARVVVKRWRGPKGLAIEGVVKADVVQTCVVSLDPVPAKIEESFSRKFLQGAVVEDVVSDDGPGILDLDAEDPPEPWDGDQIDLGPIVVEHFALALDPYPRLPHAVAKVPPGLKGPIQVGEAPVEAPAKPNPFAVLKGRFDKT